MNKSLLFTVSLLFFIFVSVFESRGQNLIMSNTSVTTCNATVSYPGTGGKYQPNKDIVMTLTPWTQGHMIDLSFTMFDLDEDGDFLIVYDGANINAPVIQYLSGNQLPERIIASNPAGQLTLRFSSSMEWEAYGFKAKVTCFDPTKPPAIPSNLNAYAVSNQVVLNWKDNSVREKGFRIQRSLAIDRAYKTIAFIGADVTDYKDETAAQNTVYYYKIAAYNDYAISDYTTPIKVRTGPAPTPMQNGSITTCNAVFVDPGGMYNNYPNNSNLVTTIHPGISGKRIQAVMLELDLNNSTDYLQIYDGTTTNSPKIYDSSDSGFLPDTLQANNPAGALTFRFVSGDSYTMPGWITLISCLDPAPVVPSQLTLNFTRWNQINLNWQDNATNEDGFIIERSVFSDQYFYEVGRVSANTTTFYDKEVFSRNTYYYRVRSYSKAGGSSVASNQQSYTVPMFMEDGHYSVCNTSFIDQGGFANYYNNSNTTLTLMPETYGSKLSIKFSSFYTEWQKDFLLIYDGQNTSAPLIGKYSGNSLPPQITATNADGALTFVFTSDNVNTKTGWLAEISCVSSSSVYLAEASDEEGVKAEADILEKQVSVWPNPASSYIKVQLPDAHWTEVVLRDLNGRRVDLGGKVPLQKEMEFDISHLKRGLYILELNGKGKTVRKKVVIM